MISNYAWYDEGGSPLGRTNSPVLTFAADQRGNRLTFPFRMADGRDGGKLEGTLTFWVYHLRNSDALTVDVNGRPVERTKIQRFPTGQRRGGLPGLRFEIPLADCAPFRGDNELGLTLTSPTDHQQPPYMEELEITVRENVEN